MKSPFPGMDPYLEEYWGDVHTTLATYARDQLQEQLPEDLIACVEESMTVGVEGGTGEEMFRYRPDVRIEDLGPSFEKEHEATAVALGEDTIEVPIRSEPMTQRSIRIVERDGGKDRIITAIELLSPSNKTSAAGRNAYRRKRKHLRKAGVSLVEIDLVRAGRPNFALSYDRFPRKFRTTYGICVLRAWRRSVVQIYRVPLRERLPNVSIPLRRKDREVVLNLQAVIDTVYEKGRYHLRGYKDPIAPPLSPDDAAWADQLLREKGLK